jgi:hypothetical protein
MRYPSRAAQHSWAACFVGDITGGVLFTVSVLGAARCLSGKSGHCQGYSGYGMRSLPSTRFSARLLDWTQCLPYAVDYSAYGSAPTLADWEAIAEGLTMDSAISRISFGQPTRTWADRAPPPRVLVCVEHKGVRELISLMLAHMGCTVAGMRVMAWLAGDPIPGACPAVLILDTWPLRHADAIGQARLRLAAQPAALVLLSDNPAPAQLVDELGAVATLPLCFNLHDLVAAVQMGYNALAREVGA